MLHLLSLLRETTVPFLAPLVREVNDDFDQNIYISYEQGRHEFVGVVDLPQSQLESRLKQELGFEENPLAAWKTLAGTSEAEQASLRYVDADSEYYGLTPPSKAAAHERDGGHSHQLHIVLYELDEEQGTTAVCAHHELAWDAYPLKHYRGVYYNPAFGERMFEAMCDDLDLPLNAKVAVAEANQ